MWDNELAPDWIFGGFELRLLESGVNYYNAFDAVLFRNLCDAKCNYDFICYALIKPQKGNFVRKLYVLLFKCLLSQMIFALNK